jgi:septum formation protein
MMRLVLASASPRRRELMKMLGFTDFLVLPADTDETLPGMAPDDSVRYLALQKARKTAETCGAGDLIVAADTLVWFRGEALGKPADETQARAMLRRLSGAGHAVYTGVAVRLDDREMTFAEKTRVFFREMSEEEIRAYVGTGEPMDKAGAYGAQGLGAAFIERIEGDFFNVMGLPLCRLVTMLRRFGVELPAFRGGTGESHVF